MSKYSGSKNISLIIGVLAMGMLVTARPENMEKQEYHSDEYFEHCAACHGRHGRGDGPMVHSLTVRPSDLTVLSRNNGGSFPEIMLYQIIDGRKMITFHGTREMPVWGQRFLALDGNEESVNARIDEILDYLESIQVQ